MIDAVQEPLIAAKQDKLTAWLHAEEARVLLEIAAGQVALLQAEAVEICRKQSAKMLVAQEVPPAAKEKLLAAANMQLFIDNFLAFSQQTSFELVKLTVH